MNDDVVFFEAIYNYRRWSVFVISAALGGANVFVATLVARELAVEGWAAVKWPGAALVGAWLLGTAVPVGALMWRMAVKPLCPVRIDGRGITVDGRSTPWEEIACVFVKRSGWNKASLNYQLRRRLTLDRMLPIDPMPAEKADELLDRLDEYLAEKHPHVFVE